MYEVKFELIKYVLMKIESRIIEILLVLFVLLSCSTENKNKEFETINFTREKSLFKHDLVIKYINLMTNKDCIIGQIASIQLVGNRLFIEDKYYSNSLFVFDLKGRFITKIGEHGAGPNQYSRIFDFDIDTKGRKIAISDRDAGRILFYDLNDYHFLYAKKTSFSYQSFLFSNDGKIYFFSNSGFKKRYKSKNSYYVMRADSLSLKSEKEFYKAYFISNFSEGISGKSGLYRCNQTIFIYHQLFPYVYRIENNELKQTYKINIASFKFPTVEYLQHVAGNNQDYTNSLHNSEYITCYSIKETKELLVLSLNKNNQPYIAFYNKLLKTGYIYSIADYFKLLNLGAYIVPIGANDEYIIGEVQLDEHSIKYISKDNPLYDIAKKRSEDENPVICLIKLKR